MDDGTHWLVPELFARFRREAAELAELRVSSEGLAAGWGMRVALNKRYLLVLMQNFTEIEKLTCTRLRNSFEISL